VQRRIVDLPGYGYASAPSEERARWFGLLEALRERRSLRGIFLTINVNSVSYRLKCQK